MPLLSQKYIWLNQQQTFKIKKNYLEWKKFWNLNIRQSQLNYILNVPEHMNYLFLATCSSITQSYFKNIMALY